MPTIAIVGAGPGLGLSIAMAFGRQGFDVALLARRQDRLDGLVSRLAEQDITAVGFTADVTHRPSLTAALESAASRFGGIDVLEYSPAAHDMVDLAGPLDVTPENLQPQIEHSLYGAATAAQAVLPAMLEAGAGTLLFTTGGGSITPNPMLGNVNAAQAALRNWVLNLHNVLADKGVFAAHVAINAWIGATTPEGFRAPELDAIAARYWDLYRTRDQAEIVYTADPKGLR